MYYNNTTTVSPSLIGEGYNTPKLRKEILYRILQLDDRSPMGVLQGSILDYVYLHSKYTL